MSVIKVVIDINEDRDNENRDKENRGMKEDYEKDEKEGSLNGSIETDNTEEEKIEFDTKKHFLIVYSRDVEEHEIQLLKEYGNVLIYDDCHVNIPLDRLVSEFQPHYLLFDVREKNHRIVLTKEFREKFHILALIEWYELLSDFIDDINAAKVIKQFPERQSSRERFDRLIFYNKIREPSLTKTIFQFFRDSKELYRFVCTKIKSCMCQQCLICAGAPAPVVYAANIIL
jgi:hypothetical protein